jgi:O-antigen ligase
MNFVKNISSVTLVFVLAAMTVMLPSIVYEPLMNGLQSGKTIFFLAAILIVLTLTLIIIMSGSNFNSFTVSRLDILLLSWFSYIVLKGFLQETPFSLSFAEFIGLAILYIILKSVKTKHFKWLLIALILAGTMQAFYGNLQLWGYYPSHHNRFNLTGSFFNPGPYAGYLASIFPVAFGFWMFDIKFFNHRQKQTEKSVLHFEEKVQKGLNVIVLWLNKTGIKTRKFSVNGLIINIPNNLGRYIPIIALISIALVLPASQSRAAWLAVLGSSVYLLAIKYPVQQKLKLLNLSSGRKIILLLFAVSIILSGLAAMYLFKKDSANGRTLIWKVTLNMIADHPLAGTGIGGFKANYMDYQATYFKAHPETDEAMLAGDTNYAFNELLQQTSEHGIVGGLLLVFIFISALITNPAKKNEKYFENNIQQNYLLKENQFLIISKATLLSIVIFSFFSYPAQILPIKISFIIALAYLSKSQKSFFSVLLPSTNKELPTYRLFVGKCLVLCLITVSVIYGVRFLKTQAKALKDWDFAYVLYKMGSYDSSIKEYALVMPVLYYNGNFLSNYGKALSMAGEHEKAVKVLRKAAKYYPNTIVSTALGDSYKATGQNKNAETAYQHAWHMNPSRFYPKYLLAKLYNVTGQTQKAVFIANELLNKQVKIESTAIEEIIEEMKNIIEKPSLEESRDDNNLLQNFNSKQSKHKGAHTHKIQTIDFKLQHW